PILRLVVHDCEVKIRSGSFQRKNIRPPITLVIEFFQHHLNRCSSDQHIGGHWTRCAAIFSSPRRLGHRSTSNVHRRRPDRFTSEKTGTKASELLKSVDIL